MTSENATIVYTHTDEAPLLATYSFLPIVQAFARECGVEVETRDISLAGRILSQFPDHLTDEQRIPDALAELGRLAVRPEANIIKLPNISASLPQLKAAIRELQEKGYALPDYPDEPSNADEKDVKARYDRVTGSAVNPVLREGNSDRRAPASVKHYARTHPHSMGAWSPDSRTHVTSMAGDDFFGNEQSVTVDDAADVRIEHVSGDGTVTLLKEGLTLLPGEIIDGTFMSKRALCAFLAEQVQDARETGVLFSLHLKATMMKVSDPIIFGHGVRAYFPELFADHGDALAAAGADPNNGLGGVIDAASALAPDQRDAVMAAIQAAYDRGPDLAMVDSDRGITNLHVPSDVIIDASMPAMIRTSGQMWNKDGDPQDTKAVIPDRSYAGVYQAVIDDCRTNGALDPTTIGSVPNVGLMAQQAEEYGSHDKTFEIPSDGTVRVVDGAGNVLMQHAVGEGDIWRLCQTKDAAVRDWVKLAVHRARATNDPIVFWLDEQRPHDASLLHKVRRYLSEHDLAGIQIETMAPAAACRFSLERIRRGENSISVTGNVLRDYLTDLFPIMELGTSAKMLSIVPLMNGGGLFETGAGGSAPKHVQQLVKENYLRWDSLGEFLALAASFEHLGGFAGNKGALVLADTLDRATGSLLENEKSPARKVGQLDNRGSHFYLALYWAKELAAQTVEPDLAARFAPLARRLAADEDQIVREFTDVQGHPADIGGYYFPDQEKTSAVMRPSPTFNAALALLDESRDRRVIRGSSVRVVLADFGHTLFHTADSVEFVERYAAVRGTALAPGHVQELVDAAFVRSRTPEELAKGRDLAPAAHRECWIDLYSALDGEVPGVAAALYDFEISPEGWSPFPDTRMFLEHVATRGVPLVVVSDVAWDIRPVFGHHGLDHLVSDYVLSAEHGSVKADGRLYRVALDLLGLEPADALMVGDNPGNDGVAALHGITTLLLPLPAPGAPRGLSTALALLA